ncbi:glutathione S-transferase family protein [Frateuria aurantia]
MKLYDRSASGNCYKVRLFAALAGITLDIVPVDFAAGEHRHPPLSEWNPLGQLPILRDGTHTLRDSQAILVYLAGIQGDADWWPSHAAAQAEIMQWLSFAANEVQHSLCAARLVLKFDAPLDHAWALKRSSSVLEVLDRHLLEQPWLALGHPTIADCAVFPYVVLAPEGGIDLTPYGHVAAWIARMRQLPGFLPPPA